MFVLPWCYLEAKSPTFRCRICGAWHGGTYGDICPDCYSKQGK